MIQKTRILYISYDGMTDPLGQSQVLPYLSGLSERNCEIFLISFEKPANYNEGKNIVKVLVEANNIQWFPLKYTSKPPVFSTWKDISQMITLAKKLHLKYRFDIVHCRSYISAFAGLKLKNKYKLPFVFDMRGFWADERIEGGIWNVKNPLYFIIFKYFKFKERQYLKRSSHVVTLTKQAKQIILNTFKSINENSVSVIPCCVDNQFFIRRQITDKQNGWLNKLDLTTDDFILSYSGSIGTWYMLDEMLEFFRVLRQYFKNSRFLFITPDLPQNILSRCEAHQIGRQEVRIVKARRDEMPELLSLSKLAVFFIRPTFSKKASSPTKMAELMSMGIPFVTNSGVGDIDELLKNYNIGICLSGLSHDNFVNCIPEIKKIENNYSEKDRIHALKEYSLDYGVNQYARIYQQIQQQVYDLSR